jgi:hypothetical protein
MIFGYKPCYMLLVDAWSRFSNEIKNLDFFETIKTSKMFE